MNLDEITRLEEEWLAKMSSSSGSINERDEANETTGVYAAWREIFEQYVLLAKNGDVEALKRAFFLAWYEQAEPDWSSGIKGLDYRLIEEVFQMLDALIETGEVDLELSWMLPWYYHIAPWYLDPYDDLHTLKQASKGGWDLYREFCGDSSFEGRGQLGEYWASIQKKFVWPF
jgi:hypothetical protein